MNILVSNDDGVSAEGIRVLVEHLSTMTSVTVMAPDRNRSGASHSLTLHQPLRVKRLDNDRYSVEGTPTDCVHLALTGFLETTFDMVVSGINDGANLGDDILYSGTVAAAMEGRFLGLPALAISMVGSNIKHYQTGALIANKLVTQLSSQHLPRETILNVNVPDLLFEQIKGIQVTRLGKRHCAEPTIKEHDPRGRPMYWIGPPGPGADAGPGTDFFAITQDCVSVTPLHLDMTHYKIFDQVSTWMESVNWTS